MIKVCLEIPINEVTHLSVKSRKYGSMNACTKACKVSCSYGYINQSSNNSHKY